jgi:hypothetical protein
VGTGGRRNRHRLQLAEQLGHEVDRLRAWGYVLAVLAGLWARQDGEPHEWADSVVIAEMIRTAKH